MQKIIKLSQHPLFQIFAISLMARILFMVFVPTGARSFDTFSWESIAKILEAGGNPYQTTGLLNWPPFWMQIVFCLSKIAHWLDVSLFRTLQVFLITVELSVIFFMVKIIQEFFPVQKFKLAVIFGIAINPAAFLLICQHGNFDILVSLWIVLFVYFLICLFKYYFIIDHFFIDLICLFNHSFS